MTPPASFRGTPSEGRGRSVGAVAVVIVVVMFVGVAIAKPWGGAPTGPPPISAGPSAPSASPGGAAAASIVPSVDTIVLPAPPASAWTGIRWRSLEPGDLLDLVRSVVPWRGGFVAVGYDGASPLVPTPIWTSVDGASWEPVEVGTSTGFWPGIQIVAVAEVPTGLVALSAPSACGSYELCDRYGAPVTAWTSPDGRTWHPQPAPQLGTTETWQGALLASGPGGLVAVSTTAPVEMATSADGSRWRGVDDVALPPDTFFGALRGTSSGYVLEPVSVPGRSGDPSAGGASSPVGPGPGALWSADGRRWAVAWAEGESTGSAAGIVGTSVPTLASGRDGLVARLVSVDGPAGEGWWRSADGRSWQPIRAFQATVPPTARAADWVGLAGDGRRMVVVRDGQDPGTSVSTDGLDWTSLRTEGEPPQGRISRVLVLPGGVLVSNGATTWYGEALSN